MLLEQRQDQQMGLLMRMWQRVQLWINYLLILLRQPFQAVETFLVGTIGVWAVVFFLNPNLFEISTIYEAMKERGSPRGWGQSALFPVVLWMAAMATGNTTLRYGAQVLFIGWFVYLTGLFASAGQVSFAVGFHALALVYSFWVLWRFAGRKREP